MAVGKRLFVPRMADPKNGILHMLRVYDIADLHALPSGLWGIREPGPLRSNTDSELLRENGTRLIGLFATSP